MAIPKTTRKTPKYPSQTLLQQRIIEAIRRGGGSVVVTSSTSNCPFDFAISFGDQKIKIKVYIWNLSPGGNNRPANEVRIQVHRSPFEILPNTKTLILAWSEELDTFCGWDVRKHPGSIAKSASFQSVRESIVAASDDGLSAYNKDNQEIAIAFRSDLFLHYVLNLEALHDFGDSPQDLQILQTSLEEVKAEEWELDENQINQVTAPRQSVLRQIVQKTRDSSFKRRVLSAYEHQCAFCGVQLKLIDAAHIVPVALDGSTDETANGLALCPLHHRAFDYALVTVNTDLDIIWNKKNFAALGRIHRDGGAKTFIEGLRSRIFVPSAPRDRPRKNYILKANQARGWDKA